MTYYLTQLNNDIFGIWTETEDIERFRLITDFTPSRRSQYCHKTFISTHAVAKANDVDALVGYLAMERL